MEQRTDNVIDFRTRKPIREPSLEDRMLENMAGNEQVRLFWELIGPRLANTITADICKFMGDMKGEDFVAVYNSVCDLLEREYNTALYPNGRNRMQ